MAALQVVYEREPSFTTFVSIQGILLV